MKHPTDSQQYAIRTQLHCQLNSFYVLIYGFKTTHFHNILDMIILFTTRTKQNTTFIRCTKQYSSSQYSNYIYVICTQRTAIKT